MSLTKENAVYVPQKRDRACLIAVGHLVAGWVVQYAAWEVVLHTTATVRGQG